MTPLIINQSVDSPSIHLDRDKEIFEIKGMSLPEDAIKFFEPVLIWLSEYIKNPNESTHFVFRLEYFNSASVKEVIEILCELEKLIPLKKKITVDWYYSKDDEMMEQKAREFMIIVAIPFNLISY